jgi:hypothetical protein
MTCMLESLTESGEMLAIKWQADIDISWIYVCGLTNMFYHYELLQN